MDELPLKTRIDAYLNGKLICTRCANLEAQLTVANALLSAKTKAVIGLDTQRIKAEKELAAEREAVAELADVLSRLYDGELDNPIARAAVEKARTNGPN